jgi:hypothetical protein
MFINNEQRCKLNRSDWPGVPTKGSAGSENPCDRSGEPVVRIMRKALRDLRRSRLDRYRPTREHVADGWRADAEWRFAVNDDQSPHPASPSTVRH